MTRQEKEMVKNDKANPTERRWLDRLQRVRGDMGHLFLTQRRGPKTGEYCGVTRTFGRRHGGSHFGCYMIGLRWIKNEVRRLEKQRAKEEHDEIYNNLGIGI